ncbi:hypothetical protein OG401_23895 [Kitasatospora purpeofusca]|uniref:hypothetical protein n=1 Tax=Kitasatospora purpeofusca TaxID=67352 RepID=UPI002255BD4C|nr:hypothetical protein [Kitasatospora purpeofusca]MCX4687307.1 hypothetical protein [Kitasatospora purpeofusca]
MDEYSDIEAVEPREDDEPTVMRYEKRSPRGKAKVTAQTWQEQRAEVAAKAAELGWQVIPASAGNVTVPADAVYYVRSGLHRGLHALTENQRYLREWLDSEDAKEKPGVFAEQARGMLSFTGQLLSEMREAFRSLPDEIRPSNLETGE